MAIAGPAVSATLAILLGLLAMYFDPRGQSAGLSAWLHMLFFFTALANGVLAVFNMLPAYPMDGGRITRALLTPRFGRLRATRIAMITGRGIAILFGLVAIGGFPPWLPAWNIPLMLIAGFVFITGNREYRQIQLETLLEKRGLARFFDPADGATPQEEPPDDHTVLISPPPYQAGPYDRAHLEKIRKRRFPFDRL